MMLVSSAAIIATSASLVAAKSIPRKQLYPFPPPYSPTRNDGIHLAVSAASNCASRHIDFATVNVTSNVNAGLKDLHEYSTIVTFGDSYTTDGMFNGSKPAPPVVIPPNPKAGGRTTNGLTWIENIANDYGSRLMDYAVSLQFIIEVVVSISHPLNRLEVPWCVAWSGSIFFFV